MRGYIRLVMARRQEQSPPRANEGPVAGSAGYQLNSQKSACKMASSSLVPPSSKTRVNPRTRLPTPDAPRPSPFTSPTTLLSSSFRLDKPRFGVASGGLL
ncbi:hypothetical protein K443DRAFT_681734 [Laccaria amethystina LaAM-08-1]|uniref:Uncharacterized protein n=1 Tax=Laccaria amethystina LaAM-08-1 TaxID=1095629 RepID=A0A0C9XHN2_9AGAR|nr:hypothetical protein K443DRAFT_681734 [Laccaria amethystina LaAM-08-1]